MLSRVTKISEVDFWTIPRIVWESTTSRPQAESTLRPKFVQYSWTFAKIWFLFYKVKSLLNVGAFIFEGKKTSLVQLKSRQMGMKKGRLACLRTVV
jgi:hypothetical protein